jgi:hypothetical protein
MEFSLISLISLIKPGEMGPRSPIKTAKLISLIKTSHLKMSFDPTKHIEFYDHLSNFCSQTIIGAIGALYQTVPDEFDLYHRAELLLNNTEVILQLVKIYLNQCWESHHCQTDAYVGQAIREMLDVGLVRHPSCLFNVIAAYSQTLLAALSRLPTSIIMQMTTLDSTRTILRLVLSDLGQTIQTSIVRLQRAINCTTHCQPYAYTEGESICY